MSELHKFFVLTKNSLYLVSDEKEERGFPIVEKIALVGKESYGMPIGTRLIGGSCVGIAGPKGVALYNPEPGGDRRPEMVFPVLWGSETSSIVGLFFEEADARDALMASDLKENDSRYQQESARVLDAIGPDHAVFVISKLHYKAVNVRESEG